MDQKTLRGKLNDEYQNINTDNSHNINYNVKSYANNHQMKLNMNKNKNLNNNSNFSQTINQYSYKPKENMYFKIKTLL